MSLIITEDSTNKVPIHLTTTLSPNTKYILYSIDLDIIEYFYMHNIDIYITNANIEYLQYKVSKFKYLEVEVENNKKEDIEGKYREVINNIIRSKSKSRKNKSIENKSRNSRESGISDSIERVKGINDYIESNNINNNIERGIEISFNSDIYKSLYTSLTIPTSYLHKDDLNTKIFKYVLEKEGCTYKEIEDYISKEDILIKKSINNLVYTEILIKRNDIYKVNEIFLI